jgi:hypothetical protein
MFFLPLLSSTSLTFLPPSLLQFIWSLREHIPIILAQCSRNQSLIGPFLFKYDISISLDSWMECLHEIITFLTDHGYYADHGKSTLPLWSHLERSSDQKKDCFFQCFCFGHAGDQNLHFNVLMRFDFLLPFLGPQDSSCHSLRPNQFLEPNDTILLQNLKLSSKVSFSFTKSLDIQLLSIGYP